MPYILNILLGLTLKGLRILTDVF